MQQQQSHGPTLQHLGGGEHGLSYNSEDVAVHCDPFDVLRIKKLSPPINSWVHLKQKFFALFQ